MYKIWYEWNILWWVYLKVVPGVELGCHEDELACPNLPCQHGVCTDLWTGFDCDCAETGYVGERCEKGKHWCDEF